MGTRLYPCTQSPAVLEKLACVLSGTMRRLRATKAQLIATRKGVRYYLVPCGSRLLTQTLEIQNPVEVVAQCLAVGLVRGDKLSVDGTLGKVLAHRSIDLRDPCPGYVSVPVVITHACRSPAFCRIG